MTVLWWELWLAQGMLGEGGAVQPATETHKFKSLGDGFETKGGSRWRILTSGWANSQLESKNASHLAVLFSPQPLKVVSRSPDLAPIKWCSLVSQSHYRARAIQHDKWLTGSADYNRRKERGRWRVSLLLPGWPSVWSTSMSPRMRAVRPLSSRSVWSAEREREVVSQHRER